MSDTPDSQSGRPKLSKRLASSFKKNFGSDALRTRMSGSLSKPLDISRNGSDISLPDPVDEATPKNGGKKLDDLIPSKPVTLKTRMDPKVDALATVELHPEPEQKVLTKPIPAKEEPTAVKPSSPSKQDLVAQPKPWPLVPSAKVPSPEKLPEPTHSITEPVQAAPKAEAVAAPKSEPALAPVHTQSTLAAEVASAAAPEQVKAPRAAAPTKAANPVTAKSSGAHTATAAGPKDPSTSAEELLQEAGAVPSMEAPEIEDDSVLSVPPEEHLKAAAPPKGTTATGEILPASSTAPQVAKSRDKRRLIGSVVVAGALSLVALVVSQDRVERSRKVVIPPPPPPPKGRFHHVWPPSNWSGKK